MFTKIKIPPSLQFFILPFKFLIGLSLPLHFPSAPVAADVSPRHLKSWQFKGPDFADISTFETLKKKIESPRKVTLLTLRMGWIFSNWGPWRDRYELNMGVGRQRESHTGGARKSHDTIAAESLLREGMKALGVTAADLAGLPKGAPQKVVLAWWLRRRTTVTLRWVGERMQMGHYTRVNQAVSRMERKPARKLRSLRDLLLALEK